MTDPRSLALPAQEESTLLAQQWRSLARAATFVAILTSPAAFVWFHKHQGWSIGWSILATIITVAAFRGLIDLVLRRFIPWPSLFGTDDSRLKEEDVVNRRRAWFWRFWFRLLWLGFIVVTLVYFVKVLKHGSDSTSWLGTAKSMISGAFDAIGTTDQLTYLRDEVIPEHWLAASATGSAAACARRIADQLDAGADSVILHGATPTELVPVVEAWSAVRDPARFEGLPVNPGWAR